jgi:plasmid stabilization system protein ParE
VAWPVRLEWSAAALADLDRFAAFLHDRHPQLAKIVAAEIKAKAEILSEHPLVGRSSHHLLCCALETDVFAARARNTLPHFVSISCASSALSAEVGGYSSFQLWRFFIHAFSASSGLSAGSMPCASAARCGVVVAW